LGLCRLNSRKAIFFSYRLYSTIHFCKKSFHRRVNQCIQNYGYLQIQLYRGSLAPVIVDSSSATAQLSNTSSRVRQPTIAICLVIVDELHHEAIWRRWLGEDSGIEGDRNDMRDRKRVLPQENKCPSSSSYSSSDLADVEPGVKQKYLARLFIHAKYPDRIKSQWVRSRTLGTGRVGSGHMCRKITIVVMICCAVLYCVAICNIALFYTVQWYPVLCCSMLCCAVLRCAVL
jgi:hypothetical protein